MMTRSVRKVLLPLLIAGLPLLAGCSSKQGESESPIFLTVHPLHLQDVNITSYVVTYTRVDGGTKVPPPETFGGAQGVVPSGGTVTLNNFPGMYAYAVQQSPFDQLLPYNGGFDQETGNTEIDTRFTFVFYGETVSGTRIQSEPASVPLIFYYSAQ